MSRLHKFFLIEMPRPKSDAMKAVLTWASQQRQPFTIRQAFEVYKANGGQSTSASDNYQSFSGQFQSHVAKPEKEGATPKKGKAPYWPPSSRRPMVRDHWGSRGAKGGEYDGGTFKWAQGIAAPDNAKFVNPDDDHNTGNAMDRLEKALSFMGKGLPPDEKVGRQKLKAAIERWKGMKNLDRIVADISGSIPRRAQKDALHIAAEFLMANGQADEDDVEDAEDELAPAPDDDDDIGDFGEPEPEPEDDENDLGDFVAGADKDDFEDEEDTAQDAPVPAPAAKAAPAPEPDDDDIGDFVGQDDEDEVEPSTAQQAGAQQVLKPPTPAPAPAAKRPSVGALMKKFSKKK